MKGYARHESKVFEEVTEARAQVAAWCERVGRELSDSNLRQALLPAGAELLANPVGSAPGFLGELSGALCACFPGPPRELAQMWEGGAEARLRALCERSEARASACLQLFGLGESDLALRLGARMDRARNPQLGVTFGEGVLRLGVLARAADEAAAHALLEEELAELRAQLADVLFAEGERAVEDVVGERLLRAGREVVLAESCTAGMASALLARVPGISAVLHGGFVTYANEAKMRALGVDAALIERHGAVSEEVARAMAEGAARAARVDCSVSVTGVAGPGGGSEAKPVGCVWFGVWDGREARAEQQLYGNPGRELVRARAARHALLLLAGAAER